MTPVKKAGYLRKTLKVPVDKPLPEKFLLRIVQTDIGKVVKNPEKTGIRQVTVTKKLLERVRLFLILKGW